MNCPYCNAKLEPNRSFCSSCGASVNETELKRQEQDRIQVKQAISGTLPLNKIHTELLLLYHLQGKTVRFLIIFGFFTVHTVPFFLRIGARESEYENFLFTCGVGLIFYAIANALIVLALDSRGKNLDPRPLPLVGIYAHVMIKNKGGHLLQKYAENKPSQAKTVDSTMKNRNIIIGVTSVIGFVALHVYLLIGYLLYS